MTNKEKFKRAFSALHTSENFALNLESKPVKRKIRLPKPAVAAITAAAICSSGAICYTADVGGIQRTVQVWLHGDQTTATITVGDGDDQITHYSIQDSSGNEVQGGGGVAFNEDGSERPLTTAEMQDYLNMPTTDTIGHHLYLFYKDQKIDLTDRFDKDGLCYITLIDGKKKIYVTVAESGGMVSREDRYAEKSELPKEWFK